jgi:hypothetical protein
LNGLIHGGIYDGMYGGSQDGVCDDIEAQRLSSSDPCIRAGDCIRIAT